MMLQKQQVDASEATDEFVNRKKLKSPISPSVKDTRRIVGVKTTRKSRRGRVKELVIITLFLVGISVCVLSLLSIILLPSFVTNQIAKRLVLRNNSMLLERWSKPNVPMLFKVWVFDVRNADELISQPGAKPRLKELGPFVFRLKRQKDIVSFAGDNLYYTERKLFHFAPELSCCAINTSVTIPNIPLVAVVERALSYNLPLVGRFIPRLINRAIQSLREQLFVKRQVREILFDGYEVELLRMVSRVGSLVGMPAQTSQRFALFKGRNDTWRPEQDGVWAINTGARDRRLFGRVSSWNSYRQLPFWSEPACNTINGSDGTLFPPPIKKNEPLYVFNQELCRSVSLVYQRPSDIRAIQAYRFILNPLNFAHTTTSSFIPANHMPPVQPLSRPAASERVGVAAMGPSAGQSRPQLVRSRWRRTRRTRAQRREQLVDTPIVAAAAAASADASVASKKTLENQQATEQARLVLAAQEAHERASRSQKNPLTCFCDRKNTHLNGVNVCEFDGLIDISKCTKQAQVIFGSMPHFSGADPRLAKQVVGLQPNASKHTTYIDIEPNTGLVLGGKRRVQLNLIMKRNKEVEGFENINDMLVPLVWFEESALIPEESAQKFRSLYTDRIRLVNLALTSLFVAALGLLAVDLKLMVSHYSHCSNLKITRSKSKILDTSLATTDKQANTELDTPNSSSQSSNGTLERRKTNSKESLIGRLKLPLLANLSMGNHTKDPVVLSSSLEPENESGRGSSTTLEQTDSPTSAPKLLEQDNLENHHSSSNETRHNSDIN